MSKGWLRFTAVVMLAMLCAGLIGFLWLAVLNSGATTVTTTEAGWMTATFLSIREFVSKIADIVGAQSPSGEVVA